MSEQENLPPTCPKEKVDASEASKKLDDTLRKEALNAEQMLKQMGYAPEGGYVQMEEEIKILEHTNSCLQKKNEEQSALIEKLEGQLTSMERHLSVMEKALVHTKLKEPSYTDSGLGEWIPILLLFAFFAFFSIAIINGVITCKNPM